MRMRTALVVIGAIVVANAVSGCGAGVSAATSLQGPSGNGAFASTAGLEARGLVLVESSTPGVASLVGTVVNTDDAADAIVSVTVDQSTATIGPSTVIVLPGRSRVQFGYGGNQARVTVKGLAGGLSTFHSVTIRYRTSGTAQLRVLGVPDSGIWAGLGPSATPAA